VLTTDQLCTTGPLITDEKETTPIFYAGIPEFNIERVRGSELGKNCGIMPVFFIKGSYAELKYPIRHKRLNQPI